MDFEWIHVVAGLGVGFVVGMTGVGGGALMTPILVLLLGVAPTVAIGTDLWFAALTKLAGGALHHSRGVVDWQVLRRLCAGS
ncbi:MAG: TSUP family transporter, partial [Rubrivivax sp.]|nr:TSUP family transporter [Rubrivivax sp.]